MMQTKNEIVGLDMIATGNNIANLIDGSKYTDKDLSEILGITVQSINKWRHGKSLPDIENLFILSRILGVKIDDILISQKSADHQSDKKAANEKEITKFKSELNPEESQTSLIFSKKSLNYTTKCIA